MAYPEKGRVPKGKIGKVILPVWLAWSLMLIYRITHVSYDCSVAVKRLPNPFGL
jgi:hypothetical protein